MSVVTKETSKGIKLSGKLFCYDMDYPENLTLWCNNNKLSLLGTDIDDLFDVLKYSTQVMDSKEGFHVYNSLNKELIYCVIDVDDESADYGYFVSVCWITSPISSEEIKEFKTEDCPMIVM